MNSSSTDVSSIALSIDELRWLHASAAMDSPVREKFNHSFDSNQSSPPSRTSTPEVLHDSDVHKPAPSMHPSTNFNTITPPTPIPAPSPTAKSVPKLEWTSLTDLSNITTKSSPPSSFKRAAPVSKLTLATHLHPLRVQSRAPNTNRHFHLMDSPPASSMRLPYSPSGSVTRLPSSPLTPTTPASPSRIPVLSQPSRSPSTPISRSLPTKRPEWIYRHPKPRTASNTSSPSSPSSPRPRTRSTSSRQRPRPQTGYHPPGSSHARVHSYSHSSTKPNMAVPTATPSTPPSGAKASPFWSTFLRPRPRARRSIPSLKEAAAPPSKIPIPISISAPVPPPLPPKSLSRLPSHQRTPSESSTASSASTNTATISISTTATVTPNTPAPRSRSHSSSSSSSSNSNSSSSSTTATSATSSAQPETPTTPPSLYSPSSPYSIPHSETQLERPHLPLSSSYPIPSKSILTRASSVSTKNSTSTSLSSCSAAKSVTFVDVPTVHYHEGIGYWDVIEEEDTKHASVNNNTNGIHEMGMDVDSMDMDMDSSESYVSSNLDDERDPEGSTAMYLLGVRMRDVCSTPTPASVRGRGRLEKNRGVLKSKGKDEAQGQGQGQQTKGLKRLMSLTRKSPATTSRSISSVTAAAAAAARPTISGPFPLGTHVYPQSPPRPQSPPLSPAHPPSPSSALLSPYASHSTTSLRSSSSVRSSHSHRSQSRSMFTGAGRSRQPHVKHPQPHTYSYAQPPNTNVNVNVPKSKTGFSSLPTLAGTASASLRHVPSLESFRSVAGRSVRSLGSVKSTASTRGFRSWLSKLGSGIGIGPVTWED